MNLAVSRNETFSQNLSDVSGLADVLTAVRFYLFWTNIGFDVVGVFGNVITITVLAHRKIRCSTSMLLIAMGVYDSLYLISEFSLSIDKIINKQMDARSKHATALFVTATGSVYTAVAVTVERYIAVRHPIKARTHCHILGMWKTVVSICFLSLAVNLPRNIDLHAFQINVSVSSLKTLGMNDSRMDVQMFPLKNTSFDDDTKDFRRTRIKTINRDLQEFPINESNMDIIGIFSLNNSDVDIVKDSQNFRVNKNEIRSEKGVQTVVVKTIYVDCYNTTFTPPHRYIYCTMFPAFGILILPFAFIFVLNILIVRIFCKRNREMTSSFTSFHDKGKNLTGVALGITFCFFVFCTFPGGYYLIRFVFGHSFGIFDEITESFCYTLIIMNFSTNFLLYCFLGETFRHICLQLFCCRRTKSERRGSKTSSLRIGQLIQSSLDVGV